MGVSGLDTSELATNVTTAMQNDGDDREEGEIVDDFEFIISSDEEITMRERIKELEATNEELEQIAIISESYSKNFNLSRNTTSISTLERNITASNELSIREDRRTTHVLTDASSISSVEFVSPKKRKRKKTKLCSKSNQFMEELQSSREYYGTRHQNSHRHQRHHQDKQQHNDKHSQRNDYRKRRQHSCWHTPNGRRRMRNDLESISLDSYDSSDGGDVVVDVNSRNCRGIDEREDGFMYLNRDELRFALARNSHQANNNVGGSLKERLQKEVRYKTSPGDKSRNRCKESTKASLREQQAATEFIVVDEDEEKIDDEDVEVAVPVELVKKVVDVVESNSDSSNLLEEQELRMIALKSAVLNKHELRKKRHAEQAYSPTDFEHMLAGTVNADSNMDVVDVDELDDNDDDMQAGMEISPVASPKLLLSPAVEPDVDEDDFVVSMEAVVDTKPIDMDLVNSESETDLIQSEKWTPIEQIPLPVGGNVLMYDRMKYPSPTSAPLNFGNYMPEIQFLQPPPPPGVTDYEELPPPPPPFSRDVPWTDEESSSQSCSGEQSDCSMEFASGEDEIKKPLLSANCENAKDATELQPTAEELLINKYVTLSPLSSFPSLDNTLDSPLQQIRIFSTETKNEPETVDDDEEEEALRALLLSKFQCSKTAKQTKRVVSPPLKKKLAPVGTEESEDPESLRSLLLTNMLCQRAAKKPTESILKEAVYRLKMKSNSENSLDDNTMYSKTLFRQKSSAISTSHSIDTVTKESIASGGLVKVKEPLKDNNNAAHEINCNIGRTSAEDAELRERAEDEAEENQIIADSILDNSIDRALRAKIQIEDAIVPTVGKQNEAQYIKVIQKLKNTTPLQVNASEGEKVENMLASKLEKSDLGDCNIIANSLSKLNQNIVMKTKLKSTTQLKTTKNNAKPIDTLQKDIKSVEVSKTNVTNTSSEPQHKNTSAATTASVLPALLNLKRTAKVALNSLSNLKSDVLPSDLHMRSTKIIKPNKIINTNPELKRKQLEHPKLHNKKLKPINTSSISSSKPFAPVQSPAYNSSTGKSSGSRLITSADMPTVKKLIITLRTSDTETSEDEAALYCNKLKTHDGAVSTDRFETPEPLICTINNNYYDNASPISLPMDSPSVTPARANSPSADSGDSSAAKLLVNDFFEKKLDIFLRDVRSKVQKNALSATTKSTTNTGSFITPVSVRHLPEAAQQEYRSLVNRMKILEKQKQAKQTDGISAVVIQNNNEYEEKSTSSTANCITERKHFSPSSNAQTASEKIVSMASNALPVSTIKRNLVKEVLIKNATSSRASVTLREPPSKTNVLREYENTFLKLGSGIISNLNKSLQLIEEAKSVKIAKLKHEQRLKDLRVEIDEVQRKFKQEQQRFSSILPEISGGNEVLTTLKQRRAKLLKSVTNLGKNIKGEDYRLNNDLKHEISLKSKKLASQIKLVNSIKYSDIEKIEQGNIVGTTTSCKDNAIIIQSKERTAEGMQDRSEHLKTNDPKDNTTSKTLTTTLVHLQDQEDSQQKETIDVLQVFPENENKLPQIQSGQKSLTKIHEEVRVQVAMEKRQAEESISNEHPVKMVAHFPSIEDINETKTLSEYISPLAHLRNNESQLDPNGVICPFELKGQCEDNDCNFMHLTTKKKTQAV